MEVKKKKRTSASVTNRYIGKTYRIFRFIARKDTESDIIEYLEKQESMQAVIKNAIREYMEKGGAKK